MYPYAFSLKMVPVPSGSLGEFLAPNPWKQGNPQERWSFNRYTLTSETFATSARWTMFNKEQKAGEDLATRRQKAQRKLRYNETVGFESPDGRIHMLPRMLLEMWKAGEVQDAALPRLLHDFEPQLKRSDFKMKRLRLIFKVEAWMMFCFAMLALTGFLIIHGLSFSPHMTSNPAAADWLANPMTERAIWAKGSYDLRTQHCFRLRTPAEAPEGLRTYGALNLICSFPAAHETRLELTEDNGAPVNANVILRGAVLPPAQLHLAPQLMSALAAKLPNVNTSLIFVYNVDWAGAGNMSELGELATVLGYVAPVCLLPFLAYLIAARFWRVRDRKLKEQFRAAAGGSYVGAPYQPAVNPF